MHKNDCTGTMNGYRAKDVTALRKEGKLTEAYTTGKELVEQNPEDYDVASAFGWVLYEKAKQYATRVRRASSGLDRSDEEVQGILSEYSQLKCRRPDLLFSLLMAQVGRLDPVPEFFASFLQWAGLDSFREEDFAARQGRDSDRIYMPLVERLASGVAKAVCNSEKSDAKIQRFAVELIDLALEKAQVRTPIWLRYRKSVLLGLLGEVSQARELIQTVVREKPSEFWAWGAYGEIVRAEDPALALELYSKAYLECPDKGYAVKVLTAIVQVARQVDRHDLAKWAVNEGIAIRRERNWSVPEFLMEYRNADWYIAADVPEDPDHALKDCAGGAEDSSRSHSWRKATFLGTFHSKDDKQLFVLGFQKGNEAIEAILPASRQPDLSDLQAGAPLLALVDPDSERIQVLDVKPREHGKEFDCLTPTYGVIDHHNIKLGAASIYVSSSNFHLLYYKDFGKIKDWPPGSPVKIWSARRHDGKRNLYRVEPTEVKQTPDICLIRGSLTLNPKGFGFVGDAFVPPPLIDSLADGEDIEVMAVKKHKKSHDPDSVMGWKALSVRSVTQEGVEKAVLELEPDMALMDGTAGFGEVEELPEELDISYDELPF